MGKLIVILCIVLDIVIQVLCANDNNSPCPLTQSIVLGVDEPYDGVISYGNYNFEDGTYFKSNYNDSYDLTDETYWRGCPCLFLNCVFICDEILVDKFDEIETFGNISAFYIYNRFNATLKVNSSNEDIHRIDVKIYFYCDFLRMLLENEFYSILG